MSKAIKIEVMDTEIIDSTVEFLKSKVKGIAEKTKDISSNITSEVTMTEMEKTGAIKEFRDFVEKQSELAQPYTVGQKATHLLSSIPGAGKVFKKVYKDMKAAHLDTESIKDVVENMYTKMEKKNEMISNRVIKLYKLEEYLQEMLSEMKGVFIEIESEIEKEDDKKEKHKLKMLSVNVQKRIKELFEEQTRVQQITVVIEELSMTIEESMPSDKDALLRKMGTFASIAAAQDHINEFLELKDILRNLDDNSTRTITTAINSILDAKDADKEDMRRMDARLKERKKGLELIQKRLDKSEKETEQTYLEMSNTTRLMIENKA